MMMKLQKKIRTPFQKRNKWKWTISLLILDMMITVTYLLTPKQFEDCKKQQTIQKKKNDHKSIQKILSKRCSKNNGFLLAGHGN